MLKQLPEVNSYRKGVAMMNDFSSVQGVYGSNVDRDCHMYGHGVLGERH